MRKRVLACVFAVVTASLFWPAELPAGECFGCYDVRFPFPDGTSEDLVLCLSLADSNATGCYEINQGLGCIEWFPGSCDPWGDPTEPPAV